VSPITANRENYERPATRAKRGTGRTLTHNNTPSGGSCHSPAIKSCMLFHARVLVSAHACRKRKYFVPPGLFSPKRGLRAEVRIFYFVAIPHKPSGRDSGDWTYRA